MNEVPTRGGKYCPHCSTMARHDATHCTHCGHQFSTGLTPTPLEALHQPLAEAELNRTRMFTLPPFVPRESVSGEDAPATVLSAEEVADLEKSLASVRRVHWNWSYVGFALVIIFACAFVWWLVGRL